MMEIIHVFMADPEIVMRECSMLLRVPRAYEFGEFGEAPVGKAAERY